MNIFSSIDDFECTKKTILTLGTFDGVHFGHKKILEKLTLNTNNNQFESLVLTFFPHPRMVLDGQSDVLLLNTIDEKIELLEKIGIQNLVIHPFDEAFSKLTAEEFVKNILVDKFHIHKIIIGHDHRFGSNRSADINDLIGFGKEFNFEVEQISAQEIKEVSVSSTKIRNSLLDGNIELANEFLGNEYSLTGTIVKGKQLGRTIGFPTANLKIAENFKLIPQNGVYIVKSKIDNKIVYGMMNIGFNPTVGGIHQTVEIHYFDFNEDLYEKKITVSILKKIRSEQKFESVILLKEQLKNDKNTAMAYFKNI